MLIRPITTTDLLHLLWSEEEKEFEEFHWENFEKAKKGVFLFLVGEIDGVIVGRIRIHSFAADGKGWISGLQVKPSQRNNGIGTKLMQKAEEILQRYNQPTANLSVELQNTEALRLYQRLGYTINHQGVQTWSYPKKGQRMYVTQELYYLEKKLE